MKNDFIIAITQLSAEKHLPKEVVLSAVEAALVSAFKRDSEMVGQDFYVKIDPTSGDVNVFSKKMVIDDPPSNPRVEISLDEARKIQPNVALGEIVDVETTPRNAGRIAAQTAKQVVTQRLREAEREVVFAEFSDKAGDIVSGIIQRIEPKQVILDLGKTEAVLPISEQVKSEHYRVGQRLKAYMLEVYRANKGPQVAVSRTHRNLLRRLFELEVPEIFNGTVEMKAIAREPGYRSKVAVAARQEGVDPVGACVGLRGIRIQNIINELGGEKIDVILWDPDPATFVANSLSPAQANTIEVNEEDKTATVVVQDRQLSLAIGKEGQNARLAAKLTGWRIDIRSASAMEAELARRAELEAEQAALPEATVEAEPEPIAVEEPAATEIAAPAAQEAAEVAATAEVVSEPVAQPETEEPEPLKTPEPETEPAAASAEQETVPVGAPTVVPAAGIRFAEDIFGPAPSSSPPRDRRRRGNRRTTEEAPAAPRAARAKKGRQPGYYVEEDELDEV